MPVVGTCARIGWSRIAFDTPPYGETVMITALFCIIVALLVIEVVAHWQHLTAIEELRQDVAWLKSKLDERKVP